LWALKTGQSRSDGSSKNNIPVHNNRPTPSNLSPAINCRLIAYPLRFFLETVLNPLPRLKDSDFRDRQVSFLGKYWVIFAQK
jgi:hypothetical protein